MSLRCAKHPFFLQYSRQKDEDGELFIVIGEEKFGGDEESIGSAISNIIWTLENNTWKFPSLFSMSCKDLILSRENIYSENPTKCNCPIAAVVPEYFNDPSVVDSEIVFYGGHYAFDHLEILLIENGSGMRICILDERDGRIGGAVMQTGEFLRKSKGLYEQFQLGDRCSKV